MASVERIRLGYNNVYLVSEADALVVIDTGPDYRGARETILEALAGRRPSVVLATHGHLDHAGLGTWWQERGIPVAIGALDLPQALSQSDADIDHLESYARSVGAPAEVVGEVIAGLELRRLWASEMRSRAGWRDARDGRWPTALRYPAFQPEQTVTDDEGFPCGLQVLMSPGHTPGNLVAWLPSERLLFSGDQLLPDITPTPAIQFLEGRRVPSLPPFLHSLDRISGLGATRCFPGHGEPFDGVEAAISDNLSQAKNRTMRLEQVMAEASGATVYDLSERLYPRALRRRFWQIIATVQGHLDVLAEQGKAAEAESLWYLLPASPWPQAASASATPWGTSRL